MTQKQAEAELNLPPGKIRSTSIAGCWHNYDRRNGTGSEEIVQKYQPFTRCLEEGIQWQIYRLKTANRLCLLAFVNYDSHSSCSFDCIVTF